MTCARCEHTGKPCGGPDCDGNVTLMDPGAALPGTGVPAPALDGAATAAIHSRFTQFATELRGLLLNDCIRFQTVLFDANGIVDLNQAADVPYAGIAVWNIGTGAVTVESGPTQGVAPTQGIGVMLIPAGGSAGWPSTGTTLTLYGTAGQPVAVALYSKPIPPFGAAAGGSSSGGSATPRDTTPNPTTATLAEAFGMVWDFTNTQWVRARGQVPSDTIANPAVAVPQISGLGMIWDPVAGRWTRMRANAENSDVAGVTMTTVEPSMSRQTATAGANTAVTITIPGSGNGSHILQYISGSWSGAAAATGLVTVNNGADIYQLDVPLTLNTPWMLPLGPGGLWCAYNTAVTITLSAGGGGAIGKLNAGWYLGQRS